MFTKMLSRFGVLMISISLLASCSKELTQQELEIDQSRMRGVVGGTLSQKAVLGRKIYFDSRFSEPSGMQSCSSCHLPQMGFVGMGSVASTPTTRGFIAGIAEGAVSGAYGGRKPPSAAYATYSPTFKLNGEDFEGGLFWDGRATGLRLGIPAAEQALGPFMNPVEQNHPSKESVLLKIKNDPEYMTLWRAVWGNNMPLNTESEISQNYDRIGLAIAEYEASSEVNQFSSKYDAYTRKQVDLTPIEKQGLSLFNGKAKCDKCHESDSKGNVPAMFTDFGYENIGLPTNLDFLNPLNRGNAPTDFGLGGVLINSQNSNWKTLASQNIGKFRTPTLRNVAKGEANKRFMHNGVLKSLEEVVHFYNTRDTDPTWRSPEVIMNLERDDLGNLGLSQKEELAIVAFLRTLSDGWMSNNTNSKITL
ncbi:MAG: methylamine metabolism protein [Bacteroidota bacterium]|jgi:cytochrome c peroxidase